jgi:hypothetical protein
MIPIKKNIYFICYGTTVNDIIRSINYSINNEKKDSLKKKKDILTYLFSKKENNKKENNKKENNNDLNKKYEKNNNITKIKELKLNKLFNIGIKELILLQENNFNKNILKNIKNIYTTLDFPSIESSFILYQSLKNRTIYPLPYTTKELKIKSYTELYDAKSLYGEYKIKEKKTTVDKYWELKINDYNYKDNVKNIKKINSDINWKYLSLFNENNKYRPDIFSYNLKKFENILIDICKSDTNENILIVSNPIFIKDILKKIKIIKFNVDKNIIENTSIWKVEVEIDINNYVSYKMFNKIYPTSYNYQPLTHKSKDNEYEYNYRNNKFILFNSLLPIPLKYLNLLSYKSLLNENKKIVNKLLKKNNSTNKENNKNNDKEFSFNEFK